MSQRWKMELGANVIGENTVRFLVWAPRAREVTVEIESEDRRAVPMKRVDGGYYEAIVEGLAHGDMYYYIIDGSVKRADPASRSQSEGVYGPSVVVDPDAYSWKDGSWSNLDLKHYIIYEMHVGTFTEGGTFIDAIEKIGHLKELGITAVEMMPVAQFPGARNWGYDGVFPYAPQNSYGGPEAMKAFVDACHQNGIAVILDVVYNHFGPEGNYFEDFGPYHTAEHKTPWGKAINYDGENSKAVRRYIIDNALYWITEYHIDALRLDAVHAILDDGPLHILKEMKDSVSMLERKAYLIPECDLNEPKIVESKEKGGYGLDAQWNDEFHHSVMAYFLAKQQGYFQDFGSLADIAKAVMEGFVYDGRVSRFRGRKHGKSSKGLSGNKFVNFFQNHDQIANASQGQTVGAVMSKDKHRLAALLLFFSPGEPLLFMGQEWASTTPFYYFTSFTDQNLQKAVAEGRKKEYASLGIGENFVDPTTQEALNLSRLDWTWSSDASSRGFFDYYRSLILLRKEHSSLRNGDRAELKVQYSEKDRWMIIQRSNLSFVGNFSDSPQEVPFPDRDAQCVFCTTMDALEQLPPWSGRVYQT